MFSLVSLCALHLLTNSGAGQIASCFYTGSRACVQTSKLKIREFSRPTCVAHLSFDRLHFGRQSLSILSFSKHSLFPPKTPSKKKHWAGKKGCSSKLRSGFSDEAGRRRRRLTGQLSPAFVTGVVELAGAGCYRTCKATDALKLFAIQTNTCEEPSGR